MPIYASYRVDAKLTTMNNILSVKEKDMIVTVLDHYKGIVDEYVSLHKDLVRYLQDQGYHFATSIDTYITVRPDKKTPINALNFAFLYYQNQFKLGIQLPDHLYLISPFLKNEEILDKFKRWTILRTYLQFQIDANDSEINRMFGNKQTIKDYIDLYKDEIDEYIQQLSEQEKNSEIVIAGTIGDFFSSFVLDDKGSSDLAAKLNGPEIDSTFLRYRKPVTIHYEFKAFSRTFEPFKHLVANVDKAIERVAKDIASLDSILDCDRNMLFEDDKTVRAERRVQEIGGLDSFHL